MGGVAVFACDNDGRLDIFPVNGAGFFLAMCPRFHGPAEGNHSVAPLDDPGSLDAGLHEHSYMRRSRKKEVSSEHRLHLYNY